MDKKMETEMVSGILEWFIGSRGFPKLGVLYFLVEVSILWRFSHVGFLLRLPTYRNYHRGIDAESNVE